MEIVKIRFTRPTLIPNVGAYRVGEIAGFSRKIAEKILARHHGELLEDRPGTGRKTKEMKPDEGNEYPTK